MERLSGLAVVGVVSGEAVARRLLQPPEGAGRSCARGAIAAAFCAWELFRM